MNEPKKSDVRNDERHFFMKYSFFAKKVVKLHKVLSIYSKKKPRYELAPEGFIHSSREG